MALPTHGSFSESSCDATAPSVIPVTPTSFSWGNPSSSLESDPELMVSFEDVMKEQQSNESGFQSSSSVFPDTDLSTQTNLDTTSDEILAQLLQHEFDDEFMRSEGEKPDSAAKEVFSVGFDVFSRPVKDEVEEEDEDRETSDWDTVFNKSNGINIGSKGFAKTKGSSGKVLSTKHDAVTCGRRNASRVMEFKSHISTGDGGDFDMKLNNNVYNALKVHSISEAKRMARLHEKKEKSTAESVMDENSRLLIFKLMNQGILDEVNGAINTGKEAVVYHGIGSNAEKDVPSGEVAIKVFKTTLNEFKNREPYIKEDYRFKDRCHKPNNRKVIPLWAEKEMHNLVRIKKSGLNCPTVVCLKKHVLVMTFIGCDGKSAPILRDATLSSTQVNKAYADSVNIMKDLYTKCELIHADLSEFNLLWHDNQVWVIDVSQAVMTTHPHALGFLLRDCINVTNVSCFLDLSLKFLILLSEQFFMKRGAVDVMAASDLFTATCGKVLPEGNTDNLGILNKVCRWCLFFLLD